MKERNFKIFFVTSIIIFLICLGIFIYSLQAYGNCNPNIVCGNLTDVEKGIYYDGWQMAESMDNTSFGNIGYKDMVFHASISNGSYYNLWVMENKENISIELRFDKEKDLGLIKIQNLADMSEKNYLFENTTKRFINNTE